MENQKQSFAIPLAIIIAGAMVAFGIYMSNRSTALPGAPVATKSAAAVDIAPISDEDHVLGDRKAPIVLVEYSDIECPFCKQFNTTLRALMNEYGTKGQLAIAFRHFPVHQNSVKEGEALECVADIAGNEAFWKFTDKMFERTKSNDGLDLALMPSIAAEVGVDVEKFKTCLSSEKFKSRVESQRQDVINAGAQGTPYSVIFAKGERVPLTQGALPYADMKTIIDTILKS